MATETTYTALRENLAAYLDGVTNDREVLLVRRRGARDVAIVPADELSSLMETAHLVRSPKNAERLLRALERAAEREGAAESVAQLRRSVGMDSTIPR